MLKIVDRVFGDMMLFILGLFKKQKNSIPTDIKKILIVKYVAMGDMICISPLVKTLRLNYPEVQIDLITTNRMSAIVKAQNIYSNILFQEFGLGFFKSFLKNIKISKRAKYDLVFDLEFYYRISSIMDYFIKGKYTLGFDLQKSRNKVLDALVPFVEDRHIVGAFLNFTEVLGLHNQDKSLARLVIPEEGKEFVEKIIEKVNYDYIVIHPGTSSRATARRWQNYKWQQLITKLATIRNIVLVGGNEEAVHFNKLDLPKNGVINAINQLNLSQLAFIMESASVYIGLDTGPTHLAATTPVPIVALYGPNIPKRWGPYSKITEVIYKKMYCSPCTRQQEGIISTCKDNKCMKQITVDEVIEKVEYFYKLGT